MYYLVSSVIYKKQKRVIITSNWNISTSAQQNIIIFRPSQEQCRMFAKTSILHWCKLSKPRQPDNDGLVQDNRHANMLRQHQVYKGVAWLKNQVRPFRQLYDSWLIKNVQQFVSSGHAANERHCMHWQNGRFYHVPLQTDFKNDFGTSTFS